GAVGRDHGPLRLLGFVVGHGRVHRLGAAPPGAAPPPDTVRAGDDGRAVRIERDDGDALSRRDRQLATLTVRDDEEVSFVAGEHVHSLRADGEAGDRTGEERLGARLGEASYTVGSDAEVARVGDRRGRGLW